MNAISQSRYKQQILVTLSFHRQKTDETKKLQVQISPEFKRPVRDAQVLDFFFSFLSALHFGVDWAKSTAPIVTEVTGSFQPLCCIVAQIQNL